MRLFKNVDIKDLNNIVEQGILPLNKLEHDNWEYENRVNNSKDVVYLFNPLNEINSFVAYGLILLEVEVDNVDQIEIADNDFHNGMYEEYVTDEVRPEQIIKIYAPEFLKNRLEELIDLPIEWVEVEFEVLHRTDTSPYFGGKKTKTIRFAEKSDLELIADYANVNADEFNYLRADRIEKFPENHINKKHWKEFSAETALPDTLTFKYKI